MTPGTIDPLLTEKELSAWVGVSLPNLQRMRSNGTGPRYVQLSPRRIGYRKSDVEAWLTARTTHRIGALASVERTSDPVADVGHERDSLSFIAPNFGKVPATLQDISPENGCVSPESDGERPSSLSRRSAPSSS
jgi:predicted DNA-binding transcriptional regulator AlpA